jgi:hypothetical protein
MTCPFCGAEDSEARVGSVRVFRCNTIVYPKRDARKYQSKQCLGIEHERITRTLDRSNSANVRARAMICDAAGIPHDADILEWISGARERIATLEDYTHGLEVIGDDMKQAALTCDVVKWDAQRARRPQS